MRGIPRWLAVLAVAAIVGIAGAFTLHRALTPASFVIESLPGALPADGFTTAQLKLRSSSARKLDNVQAETDDPRRIAVESVMLKGDWAVVTVRTGVLPGEAKLNLTTRGFEPQVVTLQYVSRCV